MRYMAKMTMCILVASCILFQRDAVSQTDDSGSAKPSVAVTMREGPYAQWHHKGDELVVTYGKETLLRIRLGQSTDKAVPLTLTLASNGRILKWDKDFSDPSLGTAITTYTLFHCNGDPVQQFKTILMASFNLGKKETVLIDLALPKEGLKYWTLKKIDDRRATLVRQIDPCYVNLFKHGVKMKRPGTWDAAAMNCVLYISVGRRYRQFHVNLPWPIVNPPGTGFRPAAK